MMTDLDQKAACAPHTGTELRGLHGQAHGGAGLEHPGHAQRPFFHRERRHRHTGNEVATDGGPAVAGHQVDQEHGGKEGGCQAGGRAGGQKGQAGDQKGQAGGQVVVRLVVRKVRLVVKKVRLVVKKVRLLVRLVGDGLTLFLLCMMQS